MLVTIHMMSPRTGIAYCLVGLEQGLEEVQYGGRLSHIYASGECATVRTAKGGEEAQNCVGSHARSHALDARRCHAFAMR